MWVSGVHVAQHKVQRGRGHPARVRVISSAVGTEGGEVFHGLMDWLGSRDPLIPYDTRVAHRFGLDD
jgi:hypothetical protein